MQSDAQRELMPRIETLVATIEGYVDHVLDRLGRRLLADYDRVTEAMRRRGSSSARSAGSWSGCSAWSCARRPSTGRRLRRGLVDRAGGRGPDELWGATSSASHPGRAQGAGSVVGPCRRGRRRRVDDLPELDGAVRGAGLRPGDDGTPRADRRRRTRPPRPRSLPGRDPESDRSAPPTATSPITSEQAPEPPRRPLEVPADLGGVEQQPLEGRRDGDRAPAPELPAVDEQSVGADREVARDRVHPECRPAKDDVEPRSMPATSSSAALAGRHHQQLRP